MTNRHSDVASTHQYFAQNFNRPAPTALPRFLIYVLNSGMLGSHRLGAILVVRHLATKLHDGCVHCTVRWPAVLLKLKLVPRI